MGPGPNEFVPPIYLQPGVLPHDPVLVSRAGGLELLPLLLDPDQVVVQAVAGVAVQGALLQQLRRRVGAPVWKIS